MVAGFRSSPTPIRRRRFPAQTYSRRDALGERAVLPIDFEYQDGSARYLDGMTEKAVDISTAPDEEVAKVIRAFLGKTAYREAIIRRPARGRARDHPSRGHRRPVHRR